MEIYLRLFIIFFIYLKSCSFFIKDDIYSLDIDGNDLPEFADPISNVTVVIGREAKLHCSVQNLGDYKVAWMRVEDKTILTIHDRIITRNYRIGLSQNDNRHFNLHINDAKESDRGGYMCQINTVPMIYQVGFLDVVLPPDIITSETSSDITRRENTNVTLKCRAKGYPRPKIKWRREDNKPIEFGNWQEKKEKGITSPDTYEGSTLTINKLSRSHMGAYLCIASNGVQPSVSKRIMLYVHFQPMVWVPNQLIGASIGSDAVLVCNSDASPEPNNYWTKDDQEALTQSCKYEIEREVEATTYQMILKIKNIEPTDYGLYKCFSRNSLGLTAGSIKLYEIHGNPGARNEIKNNQNAQNQSLNDGAFLSDINKKRSSNQNQRNVAIVFYKSDQFNWMMMRCYLIFTSVLIANL